LDHPAERGKGIMEINSYILHCNHCKPSKFIAVSAKGVTVELDLKKDEYLFIATCPDCHHIITNRRPAFK